MMQYLEEFSYDRSGTGDKLTKVDKVKRELIDSVLELLYCDCVDGETREAACKVSVYDLDKP
jgi:uncharacterized protein (DUF2249 family)